MSFTTYTATMSDGSTAPIMILDDLNPMVQARKHFGDDGVTLGAFVEPAPEADPTFTGPFGAGTLTLTDANAAAFRNALLDAKALDAATVTYGGQTGTVAEAQALYAGYLAAVG